MRFRSFLLATITVSMLLVTPANAVAGFTDVRSGDYFAAPVQWMVDNDITQGTSPTTFSPDDRVSRGVAAVLIHRMKGSPDPKQSHSFRDITSWWQNDAIAWMAKKGITTGTSPTTFSPDLSITRGDFAVMLWRLIGEPTVNAAHPFTDVTKSYQEAAIRWMAKKEYTTGTSPTKFSPDATITRAEVATFLYRYSGSPAVVISPDTDCSGPIGTSHFPSVAGRQVIDASGFTGTVVLDEPNTVYDFKNVSANRDITIAASNVEARNIRGTGARRVGQRDGDDYVDSGFRNFEFTYIATENGDGGKIIRPYFVGGNDKNPVDRVGSGSPVHIYAYEGDVISPTLDDMVVRGWKADPNASDPHNDGVHFTGISGGRVFDPTIRNSDMLSGSAFAVLARHTYGRFTIEGSSFESRFGAFFAVMGDARDVSPTVELLWRSNELPNSSDAVFRSGYRLVAGSCGLDNVSVE